MRRLLVIALLLGCATGCKKAKTEYATSDSLSDAATTMGSGARCSWLKNDSANKEVVCIRGGQRFICLHDQCALVSSTPGEQ